MVVLGFDTATTGCSAAVWSEGEIVAWRADSEARGQAERLLPMLAGVLTEAGIAFDAVDRIAVTVGPGAFTGVRIALAAARGLALATGARIVGLTTFEVIAAGLSADVTAGRRVLIAVDSRRAEPYLALFEQGRPVATPVMLAPDAVAAWLPAGPLLVAGDGAGGLTKALEARPDTAWQGDGGPVDARVLARLGAVRAVGDAPAPFYLRPPDVTPQAPQPSWQPS